MKKSILISLCLVFLAVAVLASTAQAIVVWHDPQLNWDFINANPGNVDDLDIWVDNPTYNPGAFPIGWWAAPFTNMNVVNNAADHDLDGDLDTLLHYTGAVIGSG